MIDWLSNSLIQGFVWFIVVLLLLLLEVGTPGLFYFLSFSAGAMGAAIAAFCGIDIYFQCLCGLLVAIFAFLVMRVYVKPRMKSKHKTNTDALMHQEAVVIFPIELRIPGRIKVKGEEWPALVQNGSILCVGTVVVVIGIEGNKLIVKAKGHS
jgi:membrane protein implicated in regulation of membrane protease activity